MKSWLEILCVGFCWIGGSAAVFFSDDPSMQIKGLAGMIVGATIMLEDK